MTAEEAFENTKKLSDKQLYALSLDNHLPSAVREAIDREYTHRGFSEAQQNQLKRAYETRDAENNEELSLAEKVIVLLAPFFFILPALIGLLGYFYSIQAIIASRHLITGSKTKWEQHWKLIAVGHLIWTILLLLFARYVFFT